MTQVRLSRKEARKLRNAAASQGAPSRDLRSLISPRGLTDSDTFIASVRAGFTELKMLVDDLHWLRYGAGIPEDEWWIRLYNPALTDIRPLPPAILDDKEMLPPVEFLPRTRDALSQWLTRLMIWNGRENDLDPLIEGWAGKMSPGRALNEHVEDLLKLSDTDRLLYDGLVGGRFGLAIRRLRDAEPWAAAPLRRMLTRQSLIWCAHDVQMVFARLRWAADFGLLATTGSKVPSPEGVLNQLRDRRTALSTALTLFFDTDEWQFREVEPPTSIRKIDLRRHPDKRIRQLAKRYQPQFDRGEFTWIAGDLAATLMKQIAAILREDDDVMLARTAEPRTTNKEPKNFVREWYHVASTLTAGAVAIRRLIQAETGIDAMIDKLVSPPSMAAMPPRKALALPAYCATEGYGADSRVNKLLNYYRRVMWDEKLDDDKDDKNDELRSHNATNEAKEFLRKRGERLIHHHHGKLDNPHRSFYLLDVIPEHRFCIG